MSITKFWLLLACLVCIVSTAQEAQPTISSKFRYQTECGDPTMESSSWSLLTGTVVSVESGNKIHLKLAGNGKLVSVTLVAISTPFRFSKAWSVAKNEVEKRVLDKSIEVLVGDSSLYSNNVRGVINVAGEDLNFKLIELGLCRFKTPPAYSMSNYTACTYRQIEKDARKYKRGVWGD